MSVPTSETTLRFGQDLPNCAADAPRMSKFVDAPVQQAGVVPFEINLAETMSSLGPLEIGVLGVVVLLLLSFAFRRSDRPRRRGTGGGDGGWSSDGGGDGGGGGE